MIAWLPAGLAVVGLVQAGIGWWLVSRFVRRSEPLVRPSGPITVLKPLHGAEPLLEEALATLCMQDHPNYQIVFGVQDDADPAAAVVRRLQARFPACDIALVVDARRHGANGKVGNLINMLPAARHPVLAIADSDLHVRPDYLTRLLAALAEPGTGLVTTLYAGLPATDCLAARLGATQITHTFLPGALLARALGRQDCLGATMVLRRETLVRIGGFQALVDHLADDNALGRLVSGLGLEVRLATTVPATTVPETTLRALLRHELRWARTIRNTAPSGYAGSAITHPVPLALLGAILGLVAGLPWQMLLAVAILALSCRFALIAGVSEVLAAPKPRGWLLLPRDVLSLVILVLAFCGRSVSWRNSAFRVDSVGALSEETNGT
jgi:ceramide glucosyltransferase